MDRAVTDLPQPVSPTNPRISPLARVKPTSSKTRDTPRYVVKVMDRFLISSMASPGVLMIRYRLMRGSRTSRKASPRMLNPTTVNRMNNPGKVAYHH